MVEHRSVSQLKTYEQCPHRYYLGRVRKVWSRPAAWLAQGTAFHEVAETWKKTQVAGGDLTLDEAQAMFTQVYGRDIDKALETTPNTQYWFRSGPYDGATDIVRRHGLGLEQVARFQRWEESHPEEVVWIAPDGTPGIEIGFDIDLDGVPVRGFIDAVIVNRDGQMVVRDYKTGNTPGDDFQLGVYGLALAEVYGVEQPSTGDYWMGRTGKPTVPYDLSEWGREQVVSKFHELDASIKAGDFPAYPDPDRCRFCDVATSCDYARG